MLLYIRTCTPGIEFEEKTWGIKSVDTVTLLHIPRLPVLVGVVPLSPMWPSAWSWTGGSAYIPGEFYTHAVGFSFLVCKFEAKVRKDQNFTVAYFVRNLRTFSPHISQNFMQNSQNEIDKILHNFMKYCTMKYVFANKLLGASMNLFETFSRFVSLALSLRIGRR